VVATHQNIPAVLPPTAATQSPAVVDAACRPKDDYWLELDSAQYWLPALAALVGVCLFGHRTLNAVAFELTAGHSPLDAYAMYTASSVTWIVATLLGWPMSLAHCQLAAILGTSDFRHHGVPELRPPVLATPPRSTDTITPPRSTDTITLPRSTDTRARCVRSVNRWYAARVVAAFVLTAIVTALMSATFFTMAAQTKRTWPDTTCFP
jgi:phosphate/sulfate permease